MHHPSSFCTLCTFWILYLWCFIHFWIIFSLFLVHVSCLHCVGEDKKKNKKKLISLQWETQIRHLGSGSISWVTEACSTLCQGFCKQGQSAVSIVISLIRSTRPIHSVAIQSHTKLTESCVLRGLRSPQRVIMGNMSCFAQRCCSYLWSCTIC